MKAGEVGLSHFLARKALSFQEIPPVIIAIASSGRIALQDFSKS